jgi:hypothetical protein
MTKKLTNDIKLLSLVGISPVFGDFIEDLCDEGVLKRDLKKAAQEIKRGIDRFNRIASHNIDKESAFQQNEIELWFRQQLIENFEQ